MQSPPVPTPAEPERQRPGRQPTRPAARRGGRAMAVTFKCPSQRYAERAGRIRSCLGSPPFAQLLPSFQNKASNCSPNSAAPPLNLPFFFLKPHRTPPVSDSGPKTEPAHTHTDSKAKETSCNGPTPAHRQTTARAADGCSIASGPKIRGEGWQRRERKPTAGQKETGGGQLEGPTDPGPAVFMIQEFLSPSFGLLKPLFAQGGGRENRHVSYPSEPQLQVSTGGTRTPQIPGLACTRD